MACSLGAMVKVAWVRVARQRWSMWCVNGMLTGSDSESGIGMLARSNGKSGMGKGGKTKVVNMVCQWHAC